MNLVFLSLGCNIGNCFEIFKTCEQEFRTLEINIIQKSSYYKTEAWGNLNQQAFLNQILEIKTHFSAEDLLKNLLRIEQKLGRTREKKWAERTLDIDILYFKNDIISSPTLTVPHPLLQERKFVLVPLVEISPEFQHPKLKKTNRQLLAACLDDLEVQRIV